MSNGKKLILILLFSISTAVFAVGIGNMFRRAEGVTAVYMLVAGIIYFGTFTALIRDYKTAKKKKTTVWYFDKYLIAFVPVFILTALMFCAFGESDDGKLPLIYIGLAMFPSVGILTTPNAVIYAKKDMQNWKKVAFDKGNLRAMGTCDSFSKIDDELPIHGKLMRLVILKRIWNTILVIILIPVLSLIGSVLITAISSKSTTPGDIFAAVVHVKAVRAEGKMFFIVLFLVTFGIPILAYNITNSVIMLKTVFRREYIAYNVHVTEMKEGKIYVHHKDSIYSSKDVSCVGIRQKNVRDMDVILVYIPDYIYLFGGKAI